MTGQLYDEMPRVRRGIEGTTVDGFGLMPNLRLLLKPSIKIPSLHTQPSSSGTAVMHSVSCPRFCFMSQLVHCSVMKQADSYGFIMPKQN